MKVVFHDVILSCDFLSLSLAPETLGFALHR